MGFGKELQKQRKSRGVKLEAISAATRVKIQHLRALENEQPAELPGGVFNKGILRSYCRFLGLEENMWMERFAATSLAVVAEPDWEEFAENVRRNRPVVGLRGGRRWSGVAAMLAGLILLALAAWRLSIAPRVHAGPNPATTEGTQTVTPSVAESARENQ